MVSKRNPTRRLRGNPGLKDHFREDAARILVDQIAGTQLRLWVCLTFPLTSDALHPVPAFPFRKPPFHCRVLLFSFLAPTWQLISLVLFEYLPFRPKVFLFSLLAADLYGDV
jgi:hypothetical protein